MQRYSNEDFDVTGQVATMLTDDDRKAGSPGAPKWGASEANYRLAESLVRSRPWNEYPDADKIAAQARAVKSAKAA